MSKKRYNSPWRNKWLHPNQLARLPPPPRGSIFKNKWFLIGGGALGVAVIAIIAVVVAMQFLGGGSATSASTLEMIPEDVTGIFVLNLQAIRDNPDSFPGDIDDFEDDLQDTIEQYFETEEIDVEQISEIILAGEDILDGYDENISLLKGDFDFGTIRSDWEDNYEDSKDSYKGYEYWRSSDSLAIFESEGIVIEADSEDLVKDVIKVVDQGSGSFADAEDSDLKRILNQLGSSPAVVALLDESCEDVLSGCKGFGAALTQSNPDRDEVFVRLEFLFSNERRAERAADDDDIDRLIESLFEVLHDEADYISGLASFDDAEVEEVIADGEFVTATGIINIDLE